MSMMAFYKCCGQLYVPRFFMFFLTCIIYKHVPTWPRLVTADKAAPSGTTAWTDILVCGITDVRGFVFRTQLDNATDFWDLLGMLKDGFYCIDCFPGRYCFICLLFRSMFGSLMESWTHNIKMHQQTDSIAHFVSHHSVSMRESCTRKPRMIWRMQENQN